MKEARGGLWILRPTHGFLPRLWSVRGFGLKLKSPGESVLECNMVFFLSVLVPIPSHVERLTAYLAGIW